jgi:hypothetical protein
MQHIKIKNWIIINIIYITDFHYQESSLALQLFGPAMYLRIDISSKISILALVRRSTIQNSDCGKNYVRSSYVFLF